MKKFILSLTVFCCLFISASSFALTFEEVDFEKLILNHPMMKSYDRKTGSFLNTDYEFQDVEKLKKEVEELSKKIEKLKKEEKDLSSKTIEVADEEEEDEFWGEVSNNSKIIKDSEKAIEDKTAIIANNGFPSYEYLFFIINKIASESIQPLYSKDKIVFNHFPKYYTDMPKPCDLYSNYRDFLNGSQDDDLIKYVEETRPFVYLFPEYNKTILYNSNKALNDVKIGTIDLEQAFILHPKMSLYNSEKIGFYKHEIGLSEKESDTLGLNSENTASDNSAELDKLKKEIETLDNEEYSFYKKLTQGIVVENINKRRKIIREQRDLLHTKVFDLEYNIENPKLTSPEETIRIFNEIYDDIADSIKSIVKEKNIKILLNKNYNTTCDYRIIYKARSIMGLGHAGINYSIFYAFYNDNNLSSPFKDNNKLFTPFKDNNDGYMSKRWFDLIDVKPEEDYFLYLNPYPTVLTGGESILKDVVKRNYKKYEIDPSAIPVLESVLSEIEAYQNGFNK